MKNKLIANAALQRQNERLLFNLPEIDDVPTELGLHLLDVHWARQHNTFFLTYRPAIMRDIHQSDGPRCSSFLLNADLAPGDSMVPTIQPEMFSPVYCPKICLSLMLLLVCFRIEALGPAMA
jgi:hypothetical protein